MILRGGCCFGACAAAPGSLHFAHRSFPTDAIEGYAVNTVSLIDELARRLADFVPASARENLAASSREAREELTANFRDTLRTGLRKLDLVTRDEFDVQRGVLLRTRELVEALERRVVELEALLGAAKTPH